MQSLLLGSRHIGSGHPCFIIAEAGVNHNGDLKLAVELVRRARQAGADCVKFQTFKAERVATAAAPKAAYQLKVTDPAESQLAMLRQLELSASDHRTLMDECRRQGILFLSTPYSEDDAAMLASLGVEGFKIASGQLVELPFLAAIARWRKPVVLSTGMATLSEVEEAVAALRANGNPPLIVLQCTTNYPSRVEDANLRAMATLAGATGAPTGYSDHTEGIAACLAAAALGAVVVEKHFTLDRTLPGPDHRCSSEPDELAALVRGIREVEAALGNGIKAPTPAEAANAPGMRRSIVAARRIPAGKRAEPGDFAFKRPATGLAPKRLGELLGRAARREISPDSLVQVEDFE